MRKLAAVVDVSNVTNIRQAHQSLSKMLGFPASYGTNWDAFWDAITGLVEMPERLQFIGWAAFEKRFPEDAEILRRLLAQMFDMYPNDAAHVEYL
ncbi:barstar family protein [Oxalobacteraceae sp. CFBP 13730]|jgi:RNAse (barnase) inhibitor barstar|nr:barstar family protein [Oxalobacteraceae sp. CFBP 13730]